MKNRALEGSLSGNILALSVPTMAGFFLQTMYDLVDMMWIGQISSSAIAAVTLFATVFWAVEVLNTVIGVSSISLIGQSYGSGNEVRTRRAIEQTLIFKGLVACAAAVLLLLFYKPLMWFFTSDPEVVDLAIEYGYLRIFFLPVMYSSFTVNTALRAIGDAKKPLYIMAFSAILNICLDPIFMFDSFVLNRLIDPFSLLPEIVIPGFGLGVFGAALATVISTCLAFLLGLYILFSGRTYVKLSIKTLFKLEKDISIKLITIGLPSGFSNLVRQISGFVIMKLMGLFGTAAIASFGIAFRLFGLAFMPMLGLSMGGSTIVSHALGAERVDLAEKSVLLTALYSFFFGVLTFGLGILFSKQIFGFFTNDAEVIAIGSAGIVFFAPALLALGLAMGISSSFSGAGDNLPRFYATLVSRWMFQVPFLLVGVLVFQQGLTYIWLAYSLTELCEFLVTLYFYSKGSWKRRRVI